MNHYIHARTSNFLSPSVAISTASSCSDYVNGIILPICRDMINKVISYFFLQTRDISELWVAFEFLWFGIYNSTLHLSILHLIHLFPQRNYLIETKDIFPKPNLTQMKAVIQYMFTKPTFNDIRNTKPLFAIRNKNPIRSKEEENDLQLPRSNSLQSSSVYNQISGESGILFQF